MILSVEVISFRHIIIIYKEIIFSEICHKNFLCSHWESSHHSYRDEDYAGTRDFTCTLLSSCDHRNASSDYPLVTNSGSRRCHPDPFKRRACGGCPQHAKFCHGRCHMNIQCFSFGAGGCKSTPYYEGAGSTCSQQAMEAQENDCSAQCVDITSSSGASSCQDCITSNIEDYCQYSSGNLCWFCGESVLEKWVQCHSSDLGSVATVDCIEQAIVPRCGKCVCALLCYWSPEGDLCRSCQEQPQFDDHFPHNQHCPQGWVYSESSSTCFRAYTNPKPWKFAVSFCESGGGYLAQPQSTDTMYAAMEAINLLGGNGKYWLGGEENGKYEYNLKVCCSFNQSHILLNINMQETPLSGLEATPLWIIKTGTMGSQYQVTLITSST